MARETILIIEDEEDILELVAYNLEKENYRVLKAESGEDGVALAKRELPDLIILDLMLPGIDGLDVCRELKREDKTAGIPIIMLTAKGEEADIVVGLELGADDYITKPFSVKVLLARIKAVIRRSKRQCHENSSTTLKIHNIEINPAKFEVKVNGKEVRLTATEFKILKCLAEKPGWIFTRSQIMDAVHGETYIATDRSIDVQIAGLRKKLGPAGKFIETVRGVGYRIKDEE